MKRLNLIRISLVGLIICLTFGGCQERSSPKLGFTAALTGRAAGLGTTGRNGFLLAVEQANARGGIHGQPVATLVVDNQMDPETARRVATELVQNGVAAIIGPMTSQMALATVPITNQAAIPLVAPTVSTNQLTGKDDYFFRSYYSNAQAAQLLASRLAGTSTATRMAVIYDIGNRAYTEDWLQMFRQNLESRGGEIVTALPFEMQQDTLFTSLVTDVVSSDPTGILILANALDTALICQQIVKQNTAIPRYATGWSYSDDLLKFGGQAVEGLILIQSADLSSRENHFTAFKEAYEKRFREPLNFPAIHAYDATRMVLAALQRSAAGQDLKAALIGMDDFVGLQGPLTFDAFGDLRDPKIFLARVANGEFIRIE